MRLVHIAALGAFVVAGPAAASHIFNLGTPFPTRGACEAEVAALSRDDHDMLLDNFPNLFSSEGEVASFLTRAFPCELNAADGQWYIIDRRVEVIGSDWFQNRL